MAVTQRCQPKEILSLSQ